MSIKLVTPPDLTLLPTGLLTSAKAQLRIDWNYDDQFIKDCTARALGRFEQLNGVALNKQTFEWRPDQSEFCDSRAVVPVTPAQTFTVKDANAVDISTAFTITTNTVFGVPLLYLNGAWQSGMVVTIATGFDPDKVPPPVLDVVMRNMAHLYEHREILLPGSEFVAPDLQVDATWWVPRV